jgi:hypothetical protein
MEERTVVHHLGIFMFTCFFEASQAAIQIRNLSAASFKSPKNLLENPPSVRRKTRHS